MTRRWDTTTNEQQLLGFLYANNEQSKTGHRKVPFPMTPKGVFGIQLTKVQSPCTQTTNIAEAN